VAVWADEIVSFLVSTTLTSKGTLIILSVAHGISIWTLQEYVVLPDPPLKLGGIPCGKVNANGHKYDPDAKVIYNNIVLL